MATRSSILAWEIPRIEEPAGPQRVEHDLATKQQTIGPQLLSPMWPPFIGHELHSRHNRSRIMNLEHPLLGLLLGWRSHARKNKLGRPEATIPVQKSCLQRCHIRRSKSLMHPQLWVLQRLPRKRGKMLEQIILQFCAGDYFGNKVSRRSCLWVLFQTTEILMVSN